MPKYVFGKYVFDTDNDPYIAIQDYDTEEEKQRKLEYQAKIEAFAAHLQRIKELRKKLADDKRALDKARAERIIAQEEARQARYEADVAKYRREWFDEHGDDIEYIPFE